MDDLIHDFQMAFSTGKVTPSDMCVHSGDSFSLVDVCDSPPLIGCP
jgi:hypothetical protein